MPRTLMTVKTALSRIRLCSRIITPAMVQDTDDTKNRTKPQPDAGRLRAIRAAPVTPNTVPVHLAILIVGGIVSFAPY